MAQTVNSPPRPTRLAELRVFARESMSVGWYEAAFFRAFVDEDDDELFTGEDARYLAAITPQTVLALLDVADAAKAYAESFSSDEASERLAKFRALRDALKRAEQ